MEYGIRRYEATQRLLWFLFFLLCLAIAYPLSSLWLQGQANCTVNPEATKPEALKSCLFWFQLFWTQVAPLGRIIVYLIWVALLFLAGHLLWLLTQVVGKYLVKNLFKEHIQKSSGRPKPAPDGPIDNPGKLFPSEVLLREIDRRPYQFLFLPFKRLRLMLTNPQDFFSAEELMDKERRIVETDWQLLWTSWLPFRWLVWLLPVLALLQASWIFYLHLEPALSGQQELPDMLVPFAISLMPLVQVIVLCVVLSLASGLLKRLENLYLSNLDGMFYDKLLSRMPFQSSDTVIVLEALQRHFQEMQAVLRRLENALSGDKHT